MFSKNQTPADCAETFKAVIANMKSCSESEKNSWPLDVMVEIGNIFQGPSRNRESDISHFNFQDLSNSNKNNEAHIRYLCSKTFEKFIWKLEKVGIYKVG